MSGEEEWGASLPYYHTCAVRGSSVIIPCSFTYPPNHTVTKVFWAKYPQPDTELTDFSENPGCKHRVLYSRGDKNCTMVLKDVKFEDAGNYHPRIITQIDKWLGQPALQLSVTGGLDVDILADCLQTLLHVFLLCLSI